MRGWGRALLPLLLLAASPLPAAEGPLVIGGETVWQGRQVVGGDVLVTETGRLIVLPGTEVVFLPSQGTRTDPQFYSTETELVVRGSLVTGGTASAPVVFRGEGEARWGGIIADGAREVSLAGTTVRGAQGALTLLDSAAQVSDSLLTGSGYGLTLLGRSRAALRRCRLTGNDYGLADYASGAVLEETAVEGNAERDHLPAGGAAEGPREWYRLPYRHLPAVGATEYLGEHSLDRDTTWSGRVVIRGQVAVQPQATLTILPGTEVLFRRQDSNGDGLGESVLLVLGGIRVLGSPENWVLFSSAEPDPRPGDWDKVSLIASEREDNLIRCARFQYGYQAFHNHFSSVTLEEVSFDANYRGVQFQESPSTAVRGALFTGNRSAMRFRDSEVSLEGVLVEGNVSGVNFLRCRTLIRDSVITGTLMEPLHGRESRTTLEGVLVTGNREGPRFRGEGSTLAVTDSAVTGNREDGLSVAGTEATLSRVDLSGNGLDGLSVTGGTVRIRGANLAGNGRWAVDNNGEGTVEIRDAWWGVAGGAGIDALVWDRRDDPALGRVVFQPFRTEPLPFLHPALRPGPTTLGGEVLVLGDVPWPAGGDLALLPGATVRFAPLTPHSPLDGGRDHPRFPGSELLLAGGTFRAVGTPEAPVRFLGAPGPVPVEARGAVNVERAGEIQVRGALFQGMATGLHLRECSGTVAGSLFRGNRVGLRFHTSPLVIRDNRFTGNDAALRFHFGKPAITGNVFRGNRIGIFISDAPGPFTLAGNDFLESGDYHLSLGETVTEDVQAAGNWWGGAAGGDLADLLWDRHDSESLGQILTEPAAAAPFPEPDTPPPDPAQGGGP